MDLLAAELARPPLFEELKVPAHLQRVISETLTGTWATTQGSGSVAIMTTGTRPGNTLAAQLFLFIVSKSIRRTQELIQSEGLHKEFNVPSTRTLDPLAQCDAQVSANDVEYSDDSLFNAWGACMCYYCSHSCPYGYCC
jgi:hypothetical protein